MDSVKGLTAKVRIGAARQKVWDLLTTAADMEMWFCERASVSLGADEYNFWGINTPGTPYEDWRGVQLRNCEEPDRLAFTWEVRGVHTEVEYTLEDADGGTLLTITHTNLPDRAEHVGALHDFWYVALENLRLYAATGQQQEMVDYRSKKGPQIVVGVTVNGSAEEVWDKFANMDQMNRYFGENATIEPEVGGKVDYGWGEDCGPVKILELEPGRKMTYSWHYKDEPDTVVTWSLEGSAGRTRLTINHHGFADDYESEGYRAGWMSFLAIIKGMVELGDSWEMVQITGMAHGDA